MKLEKIHNPDILTCIANLSSDEVFTPPKLVSDILDNLPEEIWKNKDVKFLDPFSKSGVFLREITKRLVKGLSKKIPKLETRINHILKNQVYGLAITELTALLSRRTLYCSKVANGKYSLTKFPSSDGNIKFLKYNHLWNSNGNCKYCGVNKDIFERDDQLESYAYSFIHEDNLENIFNMKFDVIVGNPPYQMTDGGSGTGISAKPIFQLFVEQAIRLNPNYLSMIVPSRWFAGGKGLDEFRQKMLNDKRIKELIDYQKSRECFPGVDIAGGVCYFLWEKNYNGQCKFTSILNGKKNTKQRKLNEYDVFIRDNIGLDIIKKVNYESKFYNEIVLPRNPFGFISSERGQKKEFTNAIKLLSSGGIGYVKADAIKKNINLVKKYNVYIGKVNPDRGGVNNSKDGKSNVITKIKITSPNEITSETYLVLNSFDKKTNALNCAAYFKTKFVRFLILQTLSSMNITKSNFQFVPDVDYNSEWTDKKLYKKYNLSEKEIEHIENLIKEM